MKTDYFEDDYVEMWIDNNVFYCIYKTGVIINYEIGKKNVHDRIRICKGLDYPVIIDGRGVKYWTQESKKYNLSKEALSCVKAFAVVHHSVVQKITWNWAVRHFAVKVPSKVFTNFDSALEWLEGYK